MMNKKGKRILSVILSIVILVSIMGFNFTGVFALNNTEDTGVFLNFDSLTPNASRPTTALASGSGVKDGATTPVSSGVIQYTATSGRGDCYSYISNTTADGKYFVFDSVTTGSYAGFNHSYQYIKNYADSAATGKVYVYEAKMKFIQGGSIFGFTTKATSATNRPTTSAATLSYSGGTLTCLATGVASTAFSGGNNTVATGLSSSKWYRVSIVYSVNNYVSYTVKEVNADGTETDVAFKTATPTTATDLTLGWAVISNNATGTTTTPSNPVVYVDDWRTYVVNPSSSIALSVTGETTLTKESLATATKQFTVTGLHNITDKLNIPLVGSLKPTWSLKTAVKGFSVDANGLLTADSTTDSGTYPITVVATVGGARAEATINATVTGATSQYYDITIKYVDSSDLSKELKASRTIAAQKQDTIVNADATDKTAFDVIIDATEYNCVYNSTLSKDSVTAGEYDHIITLAFDKTLRTSVTVKYLDKATGESLKADRVEARLLSGASYTATTTDKAAIKNGVIVYEYDKTSTDTISAAPGGIINLYFIQSDNEYYLYEDFDTLALGNNWGTSSLTSGGASVTAEVGRGNMLQLSGGSSGNRGITKSVTHTGSTVNVDFDFTIPAVASTSNYIELSDAASTVPNLDSGNTILSIGSVSASALKIYDAQSAGYIAVGTNFPANSWTNVNAKLNFITQKIEILTFTNASGEKVEFTNLPFKKTGATSLKNVTFLAIRDGGGATNLGMKLDNFKLYKKAGEYLVAGFSNGTLDSWTKTGTQSIAYAVKTDGTPYTTITATADTKVTSLAFTTKGTVISEVDIMTGPDGTAANIDFIKSGAVIATAEVQTPNTNTWYTVTSRLDFAKSKLTTLVLNNQTNEVTTTEKTLSGTDIDKVALSVNNGGVASFADLKVIESTPKTTELTSENVLTVSPTATTSIDITANTTYKVLTKQTVTDYSWTFSGVNPVGLSIEKKDGKTATLSATKDASAQIITVSATESGVTQTKKIRIATSSNSVLFNTNPKNALIPFEGSKTYQYDAKVVDGSMNIISGKSVLWDLCDANLNAVSPTGIAIDNNGLLTVSQSATAAKLYIRATEPSESLYAVVAVNIHGYNYDFGLGGDTDVADGYMAITPTTIYSAITGAGLIADGSTIAMGSTTTDALKGDYLKSSVDDANVTCSNFSPTTARFTFLVDVPNGDYEVTANIKGSIFTGASTTDTAKNILIGEHRASNANYTTFAEKTIKVAVVNGQIDLNFDCAADSYAGFSKPATGYYTPAVTHVKITKLATREAGTKPTIYIIGDSTANNGTQGWGNVANSHTYSKVTISNSAAAGRSFLSWYREGRLSSILVNIKPGDIITVGHGINYDGDTTETNTILFNLIANAAIQRGATPIFMTPTPGGYNSDSTKSFYNETTKVLTLRNNSTGNIGKAIAQARGILFIDLDKLGNDMFMSVPESTRTETVKASYTDHNHFSIQGANAIAKLVLDQIFKSSLFNYIPQKNITVTGNYSTITSDNKITLTLSINNDSTKLLNPYIYIAEYDSKKLLVGVKQANFNSTSSVAVSILPGVFTSLVSDTSTAVKIKDNSFEYTMINPNNTLKAMVLQNGTFEPLSKYFAK